MTRSPGSGLGEGEGSFPPLGSGLGGTEGEGSLTWLPTPATPPLEAQSHGVGTTEPSLQVAITWGQSTPCDGDGACTGGWLLAERLASHDPAKDLWMIWLVQALLAVGVIALVAGLLVRLVAGIPVVGPILAGIIRMIAGNYERWLSERVPKLAEQAVLAVEEKYRRSELPPAERASQKLEEAIQILQTLAPGLSRDIAQRQIEAALARVRAMGMEQKAGGGK